MIAGGCFLPDHFPAAVFDVMHSVLRKGGICIFTARDEFYIDDPSLGYKAKADDMCSEGKLELTKSEEYLKYKGNVGE